MSRSTRHVAARIAALALAALIAAPAVVVAAPPAKSGPFVRATGATAPKVQRRGRINVAQEARKPLVARPHVSRPRLAVRKPSGTAPRAATAAPRAAVPATPTANGPIAQPALPGFSFGTAGLTDVAPADPWVAAGPDHIVQMVNLAVRFQRRQGEALAEIDTYTFFRLPDPTLPDSPATSNSDGRILYDSLHGRWLASEVSWDCSPDASTIPDPALYGHGYIDFAISDTADPTQGWTNYFLGPFKDALPDYPAMGTSTDKVVFTSNVFPIAGVVGGACVFGSQSGVEVDVIDWTKMIAGIGPNDATSFVPSDPTLATFATPRAAVQVPATSATIFGVIEMANGSADDVGFFTITGTQSTASLLFNVTDITAGTPNIDAFGTPPDPRQPGAANPTLVGAVDGRPTDAIWQAGRLVFVSTTNCTPTGDSAGRDCVRVTELNTNTSTPSARQDFLLSEPLVDYYYGGVGLSLNGSLHVTYSRSSPAALIEAFAVYQLPTDALNAVSAPEKMLVATNEYTLGGPAGERWGDYVGVATDPQVPGAVWTTNEAAGTGTNTGWATNIRQMDTDAGSTYTAITPVRVLDTRIGVGLSGRFQSRAARSFQVTGLGGIPGNAIAITGNVTPVLQTAAGYVAVTPRPTNSPTSATVNFPLGDIRNNNVTTLLGPGGRVSATYIATGGKSTHMVFDVTGYFAAGGGPGTYHPLPPERILDTRPAPNHVGRLVGRFQRGVPRSFLVRGFGPVPNDEAVIAVTGNLTVTEQNSAGYVALGPVSLANPATSNLNYIRGDNRGNGVSVMLGSSGELWAVIGSSTASAAAHLVFDVTGYYTSDASGLRYFALNPGRIMDTRPNNTLSVLHGKFAGSPTVATAATKTVDTGGRQGVPLAARAVTGNLAVTAPTKAGYIEIMLSTADFPTSSLNFPAGDTRSNGVTLPLTNPGGDPGGDLLVHYHTTGGGTADLILDITGYFK